MILLVAGFALALDHHVVRNNDTLARVAKRHGVDVVALRALNGLDATEEPAPGTVLFLPGTEAETPAASVIAVSGGVTASPPGQPTAPLALGADLPAGTLVCTDADGFATLRLATARRTRAHDEISLIGGTCLTLDAAWATPDDHASVVSVRTGSVSVRAGGSGEGALTVRTDAGVATADTGDFRVTVEDGAARTEAIEGEVSVVGAGGEVAVQSGFGTRIRKGEAPVAPVELLRVGLAQRPNEDEPLRRPDFRWATVERALGYRIEIAASPDFSDIVFSEDVGAPPWRPDTLFLPFRGAGLWWRVAAFDRTGFLGLPSAPRRLTLPPGVGP